MDTCNTTILNVTLYVHHHTYFNIIIILLYYQLVDRETKILTYQNNAWTTNVCMPQQLCCAFPPFPNEVNVSELNLNIIMLLSKESTLCSPQLQVMHHFLIYCTSHKAILLHKLHASQCNAKDQRSTSQCNSSSTHEVCKVYRGAYVGNFKGSSRLKQH